MSYACTLPPIGAQKITREMRKTARGDRAKPACPRESQAWPMLGVERGAVEDALDERGVVHAAVRGDLR